MPGNTISQLQAKIGIDIGEAKRGLSEYRQEIASTGEAASKATPAVGKGDAGGGGFFGGILGGAAKLGLAVTGIKGLADGVAGLGHTLLGGVADFETYTTQFSVLLKGTDDLSVGTERAKQRIGELSQFAAKTPFELPEVVKAGKVLEAFGLQGEKSMKRFGMSTTDVMSLVGDAAAGSGANFEELSVTFGKFVSGATGESLARLQELGIVTKEQLAMKGIKFDSAGSLKSSVDDTFKVMTDIIKAKSGGMMEAQSQTFSGMLSNLSDWKDSTIRTLAAPIFDKVKGGLTDLLTFLNKPETMGAINGFAQGLANGIGKGFDAISMAGGKVKTVLDDVGTAIKPFADYFMAVLTPGQELDTTLSAIPEPLRNIADTIGGPLATVVDNVIGPLVQPFQQLFATIQSGEDPVMAITDLMANLGINLQPIGEMVSNIMPTFQALFEQLVGYAQERMNALMNIFMSVLGIIVGFWQTNGQSIMDTATLVFNTALEVISTVMAAVQQVVMTVLGVVAEFMQEHSTEIQGIMTMAWQTIQTVIGGAIDVIKTIILPALTMIAQFIADHATQIKGVLDGAWTAIKGIVEGAMNIIQGIVKTVTSAIHGDWSGAWDGIKQIVDGVWTAIKGIIDGALKIVQNLLKVGVDALKPIWEGAWNGIKDFFGKAWDFLTGDLPKRLAQMATDLGNWLINTAKDMPGKALDVGKGILDGIMSGINGLKDKLFDGLKNGISGAVDAVKNFFGIHSPSEYTQEQVGLPLLQGMVNPILDGLSQLGDQLVPLIAQATGQAAAQVSGDASLMTTSLNSLAQSMLDNDTDARIMNESLINTSQQMLANDADVATLHGSLTDLAAAMIAADTASSGLNGQALTSLAQGMIDTDTNTRLATTALNELAESTLKNDVKNTIIPPLNDLSKTMKDTSKDMKDNVTDLMGDDPDKSLKAKYNKGLDDMFQHTMIWQNKLLYEQFYPLFTILTTLFESRPSSWATSWGDAMQAIINSTTNMVNTVLAELTLLGLTSLPTGTTPTNPLGTTTTNPGDSFGQGTTDMLSGLASTIVPTPSTGSFIGGPLSAGGLQGTTIVINGLVVTDAPQSVRDWLVGVGERTNTRNRGPNLNA